MNERAEAFEDEYRRLIAQVPLPDALKDTYDICDCLRETSDKATYRIRSRSDGRFYLLKIAADGRENLASEHELLCALSHPAIPRAALYLEQDGRQYLVREYIEGLTLDECVTRDGPMPPRRAVSVVLELCGALEYLHAQRPPVIHRDIKPQNVLLTESGRCALLDFGIARHFDDAADRDTVFMGTRATAAPEQFGYMQTDVRSDVYSTGLLLLFLLTGLLDPKAVSAVPQGSLGRIIRRCMRFDPADRFPSIARMRRRLARLLRNRAKRGQFACLCALLLALGAGAFPSDFYAPVPAVTFTPAPVASASPAPRAEYVFSSPLIEQAVRHELGMDADAPIMLEDLSRVTKVLICGDKIYDAWEEHYISGTHNYLGGVAESSVGTIGTLADIANMPNVTELALYNQQISDLSPLAGLHLARLGLGGNRITGVSVLPTCGDLTELLLTGNPIADIGALAQIGTLQSLDLSDTLVTDISPLAGLPLAFLSLLESPVQDYAPLKELPQLVWLRLSDLTAEQAAICGELYRMQDLTMYRCNVSDLSMLQNLTDLSFLDLMNNHVSDLGPIGRFSKLEGLGIEGNPLTDLSALLRLDRLAYINLSNVDAADYTVLASLPSLHTVDCTSEQSARIEQALSGKDVQINVLR